jgi:parallel beta-helix repeat protein
VSTEFGEDEAPAILAKYPAGSFRSPKHALSQIAGDLEAVCEVRRVAGLVSRTGTRVYMYSFEREVGAVAGDQVIHGIDPNFMFGNNYVMPVVYALNPEERALSNSIMDYWTRFAATGDPNDGESLKWHPFRNPQGTGDGAARYMILDLPFREDVRLRQEQCEFWDQQFLRSIVGSVPAGAPASDLCGRTISEDLKLQHDLACSGDGLSAGADGIRIDLNGHSIAGSGIGSGISVVGRRPVTITGGTVKGFFAGVRVMDSSESSVLDMKFVGNTDGIDLQSGSHANRIKGNDFRASLSRGIMLRGNVIDNLISQNTFESNRVGILVFAGVDNRIKENEVSGSLLAGVRFNILATGNVLSRNTISSNPSGVEFLVSGPSSAVGNTVVQNLIEKNMCGVRGPAAGNKVVRNLFRENGVDGC